MWQQSFCSIKLQESWKYVVCFSCHLTLLDLRRHKKPTVIAVSFAFFSWPFCLRHIDLSHSCRPPVTFVVRCGQGVCKTGFCTDSRPDPRVNVTAKASHTHRSLPRHFFGRQREHPTSSRNLSEDIFIGFRGFWTNFWASRASPYFKMTARGRNADTSGWMRAVWIWKPTRERASENREIAVAKNFPPGPGQQQPHSISARVCVCLCARVWVCVCADFALKCRTDPKSRRPTYHGNSLERGGRSDKCDGSAEEFQVSGTSWTVTFPNKKKREREKTVRSRRRRA